MNLDEELIFMYKSCIEEIDNNICNCQADINNKYIYYDSLSLDYVTLGIVEFLLHNKVVKGRINFYKSSLYMFELMDNYEGNEDIIEDYFICSLKYDCMYYAVISGNIEIAKKIAMLFGKNEEVEKEIGNDYYLIYGNCIKYLILDDMENAKIALDILFSRKTRKGYKQLVERQGMAIKGLINNDEDMFLDGLTKMLNGHSSVMKREGEGLMMENFAFDSIALALIAKRRGMNITVEHELLPAEYLENVEIDYDSITIDEEAIVVEE